MVIQEVLQSFRGSDEDVSFRRFQVVQGSSGDRRSGDTTCDVSRQRQIMSPILGLDVGLLQPITEQYDCGAVCSLGVKDKQEVRCRLRSHLWAASCVHHVTEGGRRCSQWRRRSLSTESITSSESSQSALLVSSQTSTDERKPPLDR